MELIHKIYLCSLALIIITAILIITIYYNVLKRTKEVNNEYKRIMESFCRWRARSAPDRATERSAAGETDSGVKND